MQGQFIKENRPSFEGIFSNDCSGTVTFPDQTFQAKSFKYDEEEYKIVWGNQQTGEVWNKGNNYIYDIKYVPYCRHHETDHEKKSINSENVALSFPLHVKMKKLKILYSSKKIYNTKYVDNRTMQRLHK